MSATEADKRRAAELLDLAPMSGTRRLLEAIAEALAAEREKARAPFLALAAEIRRAAEDQP